MAESSYFGQGSILRGGIFDRNRAVIAARKAARVLPKYGQVCRSRSMFCH